MEIQHKIYLAALLLTAFTLSCSIAYTQSQTTGAPCSSPESSELDFWVGTWQLSWKDPDGTERSGTNTINKILGGCVIEENFTSGDPNGLNGRSYSVYNQNKKLWQQTWIDNSGAYLDFTGGMDGDKIVLQRRAITKAGKEVIQRMVFYDISPNTFYWNWENSTDDGVTWNLIWKIEYKRKT